MIHYSLKTIDKNNIADMSYKNVNPSVFSGGISECKSVEFALMPFPTTCGEPPVEV